MCKVTVDVKLDAYQATFGQHIRYLRKLRSLTQEEVAHRAGVHVTYLSGIERGMRNPSLKNIRAIAEALGVPVGELFEPEPITSEALSPEYRLPETVSPEPALPEPLLPDPVSPGPIIADAISAEISPTGYLANPVTDANAIPPDPEF